MATKKFNNKVKEVLPNIHLFQNGGVIPYQNSTSNYYGDAGLNMTNLFGGMAFDKGFNDMGSIKVLSLREWIKENHKVLNEESVQEYIKYREDADVQLKDRKKMIPLAMNFAGLLKQNQDDANELENVKNTVNDFPTTTATYAPSGFAQEGGGVNIEDISGNSPAIATMLRGFPRGFSAEHRDMVANTATKELDNLRKKDIIDNTKNYLYDLSVVKTVNNFKDGGEPVIKYKPIQPEALKEVLDINNSNINYIDSPEFNDKIRIALGNKKLKDEEVEKLKRNLKSFYIENASKPITIGELSSKDAAGEAVFDEEGNIEEYRISPDYNNPKDIRDIMYHEFKHTLNKAMESIGGDSKDLIFRNTLPFSKLDNKGIGGLLKQNLDRDGYNYNLLVELPAHLNTVKGFIQDWDGLGFGDITPKRFESFIKDIDKDVESNRLIKKQIEYLNSVIAPDKDNKNSKLNNMLLLMNSITSNDKRDKSVLSAKDGKYINFAQQILGYKDDSPYKDLPSQRIFSKNITMDGVSKSLALISDKGEFKIATPNSGLYKFRDDTKWVDEVPIAQSGGLAVSDGVNRFINKSNNFNTMGNFNDIIRLLNNLGVIKAQDGGDVNFLDSLELADNSDETYQQVGKLIFGEEYTPLDYDTLIEDIQIKYPNKKDVDTLFSKLVQIGLDVDDIYEDVQDGLEDEDDIEYQDGGGVLPQDGVEGQPQLQEDSTQGFEQTVQVERLIEYATDLAQNLPQNIQQEFVDFIGQSVMEGVPFQTLFPKLQELKFPESYINELGKIYTNAVNSIQGSNDNNVEIQQTPQSDGGQEGTLLSGEGFNQKDGGMIQRFMNGGVVNSKKKVANDDSKEFGFVPLQPLVPIQTEKMETIILPTGDLVKVNATKRHSSMAEDVVTDIVPESSYVLSQFGNTKIYKDEADKVVLEISNAPYNIFSNGKVPKVKTLGDLMNKKVMSPADLSRVVANKFKVVENKDGDVFTAITNLENKKNRGSYLQAIIELSEYDKSRKGIDNSIETQLNKAQMVAKDGGYVKAGVSVPKAQDPFSAIAQGVASLAGIGFNIADRVNAKKAKNDALKWVDSFNNTGKQTLSLSGLSNALGVIAQNPEIKAVRTDYSNAESAFRNSLASLENQLQATRNSGYINRMDVSGLTAQQRLLLGSRDAAARYDAETKAALGFGASKSSLLSTYSNLLDKARNDNEANRTNAYNSTTLNQNKMLGTLGGIGGAMFDNFYNHDSNILSTKVGINTGYQSNLSKLNSNLVQTLQNTANAFAQMNGNKGPKTTDDTDSDKTEQAKNLLFALNKLGYFGGIWGK